MSVSSAEPATGPLVGPPSTPTLSDAKRRVIEALKRSDGETAADLATRFGLTEAALRQHLAALEASGLVEREVVRRAGPGRPGLSWHLTPLADSLFPDRHADLTVELIRSIREAVGEDGLDAVIQTRQRHQRDAYETAVGAPRRRSLRDRVQRLADIRTAEGYVAEVTDGGDGSVILIEHHCPICDAAATCQGLCTSELDLFRAVLGAGVAVTRERHLLSGDDRCAYRIRPA